MPVVSSTVAIRTLIWRSFSTATFDTRRTCTVLPGSPVASTTFFVLFRLDQVPVPRSSTIIMNSPSLSVGYPRIRRYLTYSCVKERVQAEKLRHQRAAFGSDACRGAVASLHHKQSLKTKSLGMNSLLPECIAVEQALRNHPREQPGWHKGLLASRQIENMLSGADYNNTVCSVQIQVIVQA